LRTRNRGGAGDPSARVAKFATLDRRGQGGSRVVTWDLRTPARDWATVATEDMETAEMAMVTTLRILDEGIRKIAARRRPT